MASPPTIEDLRGAFTALFQYVIGLNLRVEAMRAIMQTYGMTTQEFDAKYAELKIVWNAEAQQILQKSAEEEDAAARLHQLLESFEGTKQ